MLTKLNIAILFIASFILSCSSKTISTKYYYQHEKVLTSIEENYKKLYQQDPFTIAFTDRDFKTVLLEMITDTLTYKYEFSLDENRLTDTLVKFHYNAARVVDLMKQMQSIRCTWI